MGKETKIELTTNAIIYALVIIGGVAGTIYFNYPMWSLVGLGAGAYLGEYIAYKKFGFGNVSDRLLDLGLFFALLIGFNLFILLPVLIIDPYISPATIETIEAVAFLIIGVITFPTVRYFRTRKQKTN